MKRTSLRARLLKLSLAMVALIVLVGALAVTQVLTLTHTLNGLMVDNYKSIRSLSLMLSYSSAQNTAILEYLGGSGDPALAKFVDAERAFARELFIATNNVTEHGEGDLIKEIEEADKKFRLSFVMMQKKSSDVPVSAAQLYYRESIQPLYAALEQNIINARDLNEVAMLSSKQRAEENARRSLYMLIIIASLMAVIGFVASNRYSRRIAKPIEALTRAVRKMSEGQFGQQIELESKDEIGELATEFNVMTMRLNEYELSTAGQLMAEKKKSLAIIRSISEPLVVLDNLFRIQLINPACESVFSIQEQKVKGKHFLEAIPLGEVFDYISLDQSELEQDRIIRLPYGKETRYYRLLSTQMDTMDGDAAGFIVVFQNVTQLKELEQLKSEFLANISHELKTPLTSIIMGTSLLEEEGDYPRAEIIQVINEDAHRLAALVTDVLELSKMESGKTLFRFAPCAIGDVIQESIRALHPRATLAGITLNSSIQQALPNIEADHEKLLWVINNLIDNALKYIRGEGKVQIDAVGAGDSIMVLVKDTGPGIPEAYLNKVFDKFVRINEADLQVAGTGIGLAVVKEIVERHGGSVSCISPPNEGATFIITLPIKQTNRE